MTVETFARKFGIPRRARGVLLGDDICAAFERCGRETGSTPTPCELNLPEANRRANRNPLQPIDLQQILDVKNRQS